MSYLSTLAMKVRVSACGNRNRVLKRNARSRCVVVLILLAANACDNPKPATKPPTDPAAHAAAEEEKATVLDVVTGKSRYGARTAAREYVVATSPGARIRGLSAVYIDPNNFVVAVDLAEPQRGVLILVARQFFGDDEGADVWLRISVAIGARH